MKVIYPESLNLCKTMERISEAILYLTKAINEEEDLLVQRELELAKISLEKSQKIILYGLFHT